MELLIKVRINQSGNKYLAICTQYLDKEIVLNYDNNIVMRLLDVSPNQIDKILLDNNFMNINLLEIKDDLKIL